MRKITENAVNAFYLFGNCIATLSKDELYITTCGYKTNTTKERLNGILSNLNFFIFQKNFTWYIRDRNLGVEFEFYNAIINIESKALNVLNT